MATEGDVVISKPELRDFVIRCVTAAGADPEHATDLAELLITADYRGHYSHGLNRLGIVLFSFCLRPTFGFERERERERERFIR